MTQGAFELLEGLNSDYKRNIRFFASQTDDLYIKERLESLIKEVNDHEELIRESIEGH